MDADRIVVSIAAFATVVLSVVSCDDPLPTGGAGDENIAWEHYGGDSRGMKYSPLAQIDRGNVELLDVVWTARAAEFPPEVFDDHGHRAGGQRRDGTPIQPDAGRSCGSCHGADVRFETTPLMRNGFLYVSTPASRVLALDPATGANRWTFDPEIDRGRTRLHRRIPGRSVSRVRHRHG